MWNFCMMDKLSSIKNTLHCRNNTRAGKHFIAYFIDHFWRHNEWLTWAAENMPRIAPIAARSRRCWTMLISAIDNTSRGFKTNKFTKNNLFVLFFVTTNWHFSRDYHRLCRIHFIIDKKDNCKCFAHLKIDVAFVN